jgi:hypothetical protein
MSGQLHAPVALPPEKEPPLYPLDRRLGGPPNLSRRGEEEKISPLPDPKSGLSTVQLVDSRYTECGIPTPEKVPTVLIRVSLSSPNLSIAWLKSFAKDARQKNDWDEPEVFNNYYKIERYELFYLRFSRWHVWRKWSSGLFRSVVRRVPDVSEEHIASWYEGKPSNKVAGLGDSIFMWHFIGVDFRFSSLAQF